MNNICQNCNISFRTKSKKSKACSPRCRQQLLEKETNYYSTYRKSKGKDYKKTCHICNNEFTCRRSDRVICDNTECKDRRSEVYVALRRSKRLCIVCDTEIVGTGRKYCSDTCRSPKKAIRCVVCQVAIRSGKYCPTHRPEYTPVEHTKQCATCNSTFTAKRKDTLYCKRNCRPSRKARKKLSRRKKCAAKPPWISWSEITTFEQSRPSDNHDLDHIIPLNHPKVCGLHCPENFQWLTKEENSRKSNSFDGTPENNSWRED